MTYEEYLKLPAIDLARWARREGAVKTDALSLGDGRWHVRFTLAGGRIEKHDTAPCRLINTRTHNT